jgi:hypothetical protein
LTNLFTCDLTARRCDPITPTCDPSAPLLMWSQTYQLIRMRSHSTYMPRFLHTPKSSTLISCMSHSRADLGLKRRPTADGNLGTRVQFLFEEIFRIKTKQTHPPTHTSTQTHFYKPQQQCHQSSLFILHPVVASKKLPTTVNSDGVV